MLKRFVLFTIFACFLFDRLFLLFETYNETKRDIEDDENFFVSNCLDPGGIKYLGKRYYICDEIKKRASTPILFHALQYVANDTMYREFSIQNVLQIMGVVVIVFVTDNIIHRYSRSGERVYVLPEKNKSLKYD